MIVNRCLNCSEIFDLHFDECPRCGCLKIEKLKEQLEKESGHFYYAPLTKFKN